MAGGQQTVAPLSRYRLDQDRTSISRKANRRAIPIALGTYLAIDRRPLNPQLQNRRHRTTQVRLVSRVVTIFGGSVLFDVVLHEGVDIG